jgi:tetratricopeptide (TPR) repeat protein
MLKDYFATAVEDHADARRAKIVGQLEALDPALKADAAFLLPLLGVTETGVAPDQMDAQTRRRLTLEAIRRVIVAESRIQPVVVIFEDLHWIDSATRGLLDLLADAIATQRVLLLVNYRPEYRHEWGNRSYYSLLSLEPLNAQSADELLSSLLGDAREMAPLKALLVAKAEGNPFFIEEIVHELLDDGVLQRNGHLSLIRPVSEIVIPTTVQGVLAARIDRLARVDKELLQTLAVLGRKFPGSLVDKAAGPADGELEASLARLQAGEFIYERPEPSEPEYTFKHALTQEVAYNSLLIQRRKVLHERAARALLELHVQRPEDCYGEVARHYRLSDNAESAIVFSCRAGAAAYARFAHDESADEFRVALDLRDKHNGTPEQRAAILDVLCKVVGSFGDKAQGIEYGEEAVGIYEDLGQMEKAAGVRAYLGLMTSSGEITDLRRTREHLRKAEALLGKGPETPELVTLYWGIAHVALEMTQVAEGLAASRRSLEIAERISDDTVWVRAAGDQMWLLFTSGQIAKALAFADRAYEKASHLNGPGADGVLHYRAQIRSYLQDNLEAANQLVGELDKPWLHSSLRHMLIESASRYLLNAGQRDRAMSLLADTGTTGTFQPNLELLSGDWDRYCRHIEKLAADRDPHGSRMERWWFLTKLAARQRLRGQHDAAQTVLLACFDFVDPADLVCQMMVRSDLAILYAGEMDNAAEAKVHLARCREIMAAGEDWRGLAGEVLRAEAAVAAAEKRFADADTGFDAAVEIFRRYTCPWEESDTFYYWGRALLAAGDRARAQQKFDAAIAIYRRIGAGPQWIDRISDARE